jgi:hypothetical protein
MHTSDRDNMVERYATLWNTTIKRKQHDTNGTFYVYLENIRHLVARTPHISAERVETYKDITHFKEDMHHMYVQGKKDPTCQWFPTSYRLKTKDICLIVNDWEEEWKTPAEKTGNPDEDAEKYKSDEEPDDE